MNRHRIVLGASLLALAGGPVAAAASTHRAGPAGATAATHTFGLGKATAFRAALTTSRTAAASGLVLRTAGRVPPAGVVEAPAVRQTVIFPSGTTLRLGALPQCHAADAAIAVQGAEGACPSSTRVGNGTADGVLDGSPVHFDLGVYAVRGHLVFAAEQHGQPLKQSFEGIARGRSLILTVPTLGGRIAPTGFHASIGSQGGWLLTPPSCPSAGHWTAIGRFQGRSSASSSGVPVTPTQTLTAPIRCN